MAGDKEHPTSTAERAPAAVPARRGYAISRIEAPPAAAGYPQLQSAGPQANRADGSVGDGGYKQASGDNQQHPKGDSGQGGDGGGKRGGRGRRKRGGKGESAPTSLASSGGQKAGADDLSRCGGLDRTPGAPRPAVAPPPPHRQWSPRTHQHHQQNVARGDGGCGGARNPGRYHHEHDDRTGTGGGRNADRQLQHQRTNSNSENTAQAQPQAQPQHQSHKSRPRIDRDTRGKPYSVKGRGGDSTSVGSGSNGGRGSIFSRLGPPPGSPRNELMRGGGGGGDHDDRSTRGRGGIHAQQEQQQHSRPPQGAPGSSSSHARHVAASKPKPPSPRAPQPAASAAAAMATSKGRPQQQQSEHGGKASTSASASSYSSARGVKTSSSLSGRAGHELLRGDAHGHGGRSANNRHINNRDVNSRDANSRDATNNRNNSRGDFGVGLGRGKTNKLSEASGVRGIITIAPASKVRDNAQHQPRQKQCGRPHQEQLHQHRKEQEQQQRQQQQQQQQQQQGKERQRGQGDYARGTCVTMCPESEMREREAEGGLSSFEATEATAKACVPFRNRVVDPEKAVKKYRRSAAGRDMQSPEQLRPLTVLQTTARYLVKGVFAKACSNSRSDNNENSYNSGGEQRGRSPGPSSIAKAYAFVEDRLRAVRQDLTVQGLVLTASEGAAEVLKTAANFYIVAGYLMADEASDVFDRHLHTRELQGVFSSLGELFFQARGAVVPCVPDEPFQALGVDEYLCLQAVHALATAITNTSKGGDTQLGVAAGGQGVGRLVMTTVCKLYSSSISRANRSAVDGDAVAAASAAVATTTAGAEAAKTGGATEGLKKVNPMSEPFRNLFPKMAMAVRLVGVVGAGNWSEFFRMLGVDSGLIAPESSGGGAIDAIDGDGCSSGGESGVCLVGGELASSSFAVRLRCLCHAMLLSVRAHALRAMNMAYGKNEKVPLADVARMLRTRDEDHAAGICRALSLPIDESNSISNSNNQDGVVRSVVFKSVPAVWKSEKVRAEGKGFCFRSGEREKSAMTTPNFRSSSAREDEFVGLARALAVTVADMTNDRKEDSPATVTCGACAGFGCSWCENGVVKAEDVVIHVGGQEEGLWEAALRPT